MTPDEARAFIAACRWTFATAPDVQDHPHEYVARARLTPALQASFDALVALIERDGYVGRFWGSSWRYVDLDEHAYWPSQSWYGPDAGRPNTMLNRRRLDVGQLRLEVSA
jgi:hypothetical protein